jgi:hypothetical protein
VEPLGRPLRQRTTLYGEPGTDRQAAAAASDGVCASVRQGLPILAASGPGPWRQPSSPSGSKTVGMAG